jgi:hypothetical protein
MGSTSNYGLPYPDNTDPLDIAGDIQALADSIDTELLDVANAGTGSLLVAYAYDASPTATISNTTTETSLVSYSVSGASAGNIYRVKAGGSYLNNTGTNRTITMRAKLGSTTVVSGTSGNLTTNASERAWTWWLDLYVESTSAQVMSSVFTLGGPGLSSTILTANIIASTNGIGTATEDLTSAKTWDLTGQLSVASTNNTMTLYYYEIVRLLP